MKRTTIASRQKGIHELCSLFNVWMAMDDETLFARAKDVIPALTEATREECIKVLTIDHCEKNFY